MAGREKRRTVGELAGVTRIYRTVALGMVGALAVILPSTLMMRSYNRDMEDALRKHVQLQQAFELSQEVFSRAVTVMVPGQEEPLGQFNVRFSINALAPGFDQFHQGIVSQTSTVGTVEDHLYAALSAAFEASTDFGPSRGVVDIGLMKTAMDEHLAESAFPFIQIVDLDFIPAQNNLKLERVQHDIMPEA